MASDETSETAAEIVPRDAWPHYEPVRYFPTPRGVWTREAVVEAIQRWTAETGAAPTTSDWDPSTARGAGLIGPAPTKFEREREEWPSMRLVYRHFRSWQAACDAAGVRPRRRANPSGTVASRIAYARRRAAEGVSTSVIASELGVADPTAWRYLRATDCKSCGEPVASARDFCVACAAQRSAKPRWTEQDVIAAAAAWREETGALPKAHDWLPGGERYDREPERWPTAGAVRVTIGGFQELRAAFGERPHNPPWTAELMLAALRSFAAAHGCAPQQTELAGSDGKYPTASTLAATFGSFDAAVEAAGLTPRSRFRRWDRDRILWALRAFEREHGRPPKRTEWRRGTVDHPSDVTVVKRFGSWDAALAAATAGKD